jgi:hypothetical protein
MKTTMPRVSLRAALLVIPALYCTVASFAEEPLSTTAQRLNETAVRQGETVAVTHLSTQFTPLAGSDANARALVTGLRDGTVVTLNTTAADGTITATEFQPATGKLGYGNAYISLALAGDSLAKAGVTDPTAPQLIAALNGGEITRADGTVVTLSGILALRAAGQGWGDIAQTLGVKLGPIVSSLHTANRRVENPSRPAPTGKPDRVGGKPDHIGGKPQVAGRPESVGRPMNVGRPEGVGRPVHLPPPMPPRGGKP